MSDGLTYEQAAAILGCHVSNVAKLVRKGDLTSTGKRGASLSREQVDALSQGDTVGRSRTSEPTAADALPRSADLLPVLPDPGWTASETWVVTPFGFAVALTAPRATRSAGVTDVLAATE